MRTATSVSLTIVDETAVSLTEPGGDIGCFGAFTPRNQRPFTLDNDHIRLYMVKTMDCKDCTKLRSEDIARKYCCPFHFPLKHPFFLPVSLSPFSVLLMKKPQQQ